MAQALRITITIFHLRACCMYYNFNYLFLRCVNDIDQELKVKSSKLKVAILTTYNFKLLITLKILRRLWRWGPPLPIPNRAVKTTSADGTRVKPGRVSRCPNF